MRRHHGLRARSARCCRDHIWRRGSGRHDQLGPPGWRHVNRRRVRDLCGHCVTGLTGTCRRFRGGGKSHGVLFAWPRLWLGRWDNLDGTPPEWCGQRRRSRGTPIDNRRLDRCLLRRPRDRVDRGRRACDGSQNEHEAQLGRLNASFLPGEAQARKPKSLATEGHAQQQSVKQQREQQRSRHSPALRAHALDPRLPARGGLRRSLGWRTRWRCQRGVETLARSRTLPSPLRPQARQRLRS